MKLIKKEARIIDIKRKLKEEPSRIVQWKLFKKTFFYFYQEEGFGWFRLFGYGIHWKDTAKHGFLFSERYGFTKHIRIGRFLIKWLQ